MRAGVKMCTEGRRVYVMCVICVCVCYRRVNKSLQWRMWIETWV